MFCAFYPSVQEESEELKELFTHYPEGLFKAVGLEIDKIGNIFGSMESFMATEHYSIMWPLLIIVLVISLGSNFISGEIEKSTMEFLLSQPISRFQIFAGKYISGVILVIIFTIISVFSIIPFAVLYDFDISLKSNLYIGIIGFLFGLSIFSISMMFSCIVSRKGIASMLTTGLVILMYAANVASAFNESAEWLQYLSLFHYYDYNSALIDAVIGGLNVIVFMGTIIISTIVSGVIFLKRDLVK
ncbi:ABC transporter permease subunit [Candidatus Dojkabacteria bacterium]|nr:ABC transporter permease subunit [Candidatus Dojkabacteria bacterium]